jgi:hypothetical protein
MTKEFLDNFCLPDGTIQWKELVEFNASIIPPKKKLVVPTWALIFRPPPAVSWPNACAMFAPAGKHLQIGCF